MSISSFTFVLSRTAEEASEVAEAASHVSACASKLSQSLLKCVQYGVDDVYHGVRNWDRVEQELRELIALAEALGLNTTPCPEKMNRVKYWLEYAQARGVVEK